MRAAFLCYLVQAWTADRYRQTQREAPARAWPAAREHRGAGTAPACSRPRRRAACLPCWAAAVHDQAAHRATTPGTGRGRPSRPGASHRRIRCPHAGR
jgi:hypothetical protein